MKGMEELNEQASIGMLAVTGRKKQAGRTLYEKFLETIQNLPPAPCKGCPFNRRCATQELACEQFWQYVHGDQSLNQPWPYPTPPTLEPNREMFELIYADDDQKRAGSPRSQKSEIRRLKGYLDEEMVRAVRSAQGSTRRIAAALKLSQTVVSRIRAGDSYQWVAE